MVVRYGGIPSLVVKAEGEGRGRSRMKGESEKCARRNSAKSGPFGELTFSEAEQLQFLLASQLLPYAEPGMGGVNPHKTQSPTSFTPLDIYPFNQVLELLPCAGAGLGLGTTAVSNRDMAPHPRGLPAWGTRIDTHINWAEFSKSAGCYKRVQWKRLN